MKSACCLLAAGALALAGCSEERVRFERGGTTFDFAAISAARTQMADPSDPANLVTAAAEWKSDMVICHDEVPHGGAPYRIAREHLVFDRPGGVFSILKKPSMQEALKPHGFANLHCRIEGDWRTFVPVKGGNGGSYRISFRYRAKHTLPQVGYSFNGGLLIHYYKGFDAKKKRYTNQAGRNLWSFSDADGDAWRDFSAEFAAPKGSVAFDVELRHDGVGSLEVKDVCVLALPPRKETVDVRLSPLGLFDNAFAFSEGQAAHLTWEWRDSKGAERKRDKYRVRLSLPAGFDYVDDAFSDAATRRIVKRPDGSSEVTLALGRRGVKFGGAYQSWDKPGLLVMPTGKVGTEGVCRLTVLYDGEKAGESPAIRFYTVEKVVAKCPEGFLFAAMPGMGLSNYFTTPEGSDAYMKTLCEVGVRQFNAESGGWAENEKVAQPMYAAFRKHGGRRITSCLNHVRNAYFIGFPDKHPPEDRYVTDKKPSEEYYKFVTGSVCPKAIYEERGDFQTNTVPYLKRVLANTDGVRANYEPFMFFGNGCYCDKCRAGFAAYAGIPEDELKKEWPSAVKPKARLAKKFQHYRSEELGKVAVTLDKHIRALTGGANSMGFVPAPSWREYTSYGVAHGGDSDYCPRDYNEKLEWVAPWGPYVIWNADGPYAYRKGAPLAHFIATKDIRETTDRTYPDGTRRPKLCGGTQGIQCGEWVTQPEWLEMALSSYFFNRWDAVQAYFFPEGFDARYLRAYANASTRAARYEGYVREGVRDDAAAKLEPVKEYALPASYVSSFLPDVKDVPLLQTAVWKRGDARALAVFNFWEKGEAFFTLRLAGLADGEYRIVDEDGTQFVPGRLKKAYSAKDLSAGVRLIVPAARTKVFEIVPAKAALSGVKRTVTAAQLADYFGTRRPDLAAAADEDYRMRAAQAVKVVDKKAEL